MMDRLFGKELSNLLDNTHLTKNLQRNASRIPSKSTRIEEPLKNIQKKLNRSSVHQNPSLRPPKPIEKEEELAIKDNLGTLEKDQQMVPDYFDECLGFMLQQQKQNAPLGDYMSEKSQINPRMRGILLDWLIDLHYKFKMFPETLYAMTMILDKYMAARTVSKDNLQLVGASAFFIAAKYEQTYQVPELEDLVHYSAKAFTKQDIIRMEADILEVLNFDLIMGTSFRFFEALGRITQMDSKNFHLAQYVLELSLLDTKFLEYPPSLLASSAIYLINKIRKRSEAWPDLLFAATNYKQAQLRTCTRELCQLLEKIDDLDNTKSLKKKFSSTKYNEVTKIRLQRKKQ